MTPTPTQTPQTQQVFDGKFYPNPWYGWDKAYISYCAGKPTSKVVIKVFSTAYRKVREETVMTAGAYGIYARWEFDGMDDSGRPLANGVYFFSVEFHEGNKVIERRMDKFVILR